MSDGFNETPVKGKHTSNAAPPDGTALNVIPAIATNVDPAYVEGNTVMLSTDLAGRLRVNVEVDGAAPQHVVVDSVSGTVEIANDVGNPLPVSGTVTVVDSVPLTVQGTVNIGTIPEVEIKNDSGNPLPVDTGTRDVRVVNGSTPLTVTATDNTPLQVTNYVGGSAVAAGNALPTVIEVGGAPAAIANPLSVAQAVRGAAISDTNPLPVVIQENPGTTVDSGVLTHAALAPGASFDLDDTAVGVGVTGKLIDMTASASVRIKVVLRSVTSSNVATDKRVFFVKEGEAFVYHPLDLDLITAPAGGHFRLTVTNMDNLNTADVYGSLSRVEV